MQETSCVPHICRYILQISFQGVTFAPHAEIFHEMPLLFSRLQLGGALITFLTPCSLALFSHPQMNTAQLQTPAVTLLQISHNSLQISQAVKLHGCPVPLLCCSEQASYQLSFSLLMFTKLVSKCGKRKWRVRGKKVQMRFNYQTLWSATTTHQLSTLLCRGHSFRQILLKNFKNHHELTSYQSESF